MAIKKTVKKHEVKPVQKADKKESDCTGSEVVFLSRTILMHPESEKKSLQEKLLKEIKERAYEFFERNGRRHGNDLRDWFQAEKEVMNEFSLRVG